MEWASRWCKSVGEVWSQRGKGLKGETSLKGEWFVRGQPLVLVSETKAGRPCVGIGV